MIRNREIADPAAVMCGTLDRARLYLPNIQYDFSINPPSCQARIPGFPHLRPRNRRNNQIPGPGRPVFAFPGGRAGFLQFVCTRDRIRLLSSRLRRDTINHMKLTSWVSSASPRMRTTGWKCNLSEHDFIHPTPENPLREFSLPSAVTLSSRAITLIRLDSYIGVPGFNRTGLV